jgi:hypothetical protein
MSSYSFSFTPLPSFHAGSGDVRVEMTSRIEDETVVLEVLRGPLPAPSGDCIGFDPVVSNARGRIAALSGLETNQGSASGHAREYVFWARS